jgi:hypothetical protein
MVPGPTTSDWATVLVNGNTSGASNPTIDATQYLAFSGNVVIPGGGVAPTASGTDVVEIGKGSNVFSSNATAIGPGAGVGASSNGSTALGYNSIVQAFHTNSTALNGGTTSASNQIMAGTPSIALTVPGPLHFSTAGNISCDSGVDNINVYLGAGKTFSVDKTINTTEQNGGAARSTIPQTTTAAPGVAEILGINWNSIYTYDDSGALVVDGATHRIYMRKPNQNYAIALHVKLVSANPPNSVNVPHMAKVDLLWATDGITPVNWITGRSFFAPNGNPANTELSIDLTCVINTTASAGQYIDAVIYGPPNGKYVILEYHLSAMSII